MSLNIPCITWALLAVLTAGLVDTIDGSVDVISQSNSDFANALYSELAKEKPADNIFFSPLSIHVILALAYVGAGGKTAHEMATGLRLPENVDVIKTSFQQLLKDVANTTKSVDLEIANKIYLAKSSHVKDQFNKVATENFLSEIQNVDFNSRKKTAKIINEWVENKTHQKIKDIVSEGTLDPSTALLLVNAVYFKGTWENVFHKGSTNAKQFHVTANQSKEVQMMYEQSEFILVKNNDIGADILELDYKGHSMSLVIILPFKVDGLTEVENKLRNTNLTTIFKSLKESEEVRVYIPKFKLEKSLELKDHLKSLGMSNMFEGDADFSAMTDAGLSVGQVLHKSFIEVNEEGTEAAAATVVQMTYMSASLEPEPQPKIFLANHPFIFILRCKKSGSVIFMGRYADPQ